MSICFDRRNNRLHVGFRATDWSPVWMVLKEPADEDAEGDNADGEYEFEFYQNSTGDKVRREPMAGEIIWHSHFDPKYCDSRFFAEKKKLHQRFMSDGHQYLSLNDVAQIRKWERELDNPRAARWQSWFDIAKRYQRRRHPELKQGEDDDDDDDDSAYDSDEESPAGNGSMNPPRRPASMNKRKAPGTGRKMSGSKKTKLAGNGSQTRLSDRYFGMSGGLGAPSRSGSATSNINGDYESQSDIFDPSAPEGIGNLNNINRHDFDDIRSPLGPRHRSDSREESIPPFNEWVKNGKPCGSAEGAQDLDEADDERRRRIAEVNGDLDDDTAFQVAREQSTNPMPSINGDMDDDTAYEAAMEASMNIPTPSIET